MIYLETIRDGAASGLNVSDDTLLLSTLYGVVAHEIGHGAGPLRRPAEADHSEGGLMRIGSGSIIETFRPKTVLRFRQTDR